MGILYVQYSLWKTLGLGPAPSSSLFYMDEHEFCVKMYKQPAAFKVEMSNITKNASKVGSQLKSKLAIKGNQATVGNYSQSNITAPWYISSCRDVWIFEPGGV